MCRITDERQAVNVKPQSLFDVHFGGKKPTPMQVIIHQYTQSRVL